MQLTVTIAGGKRQPLIEGSSFNFSVDAKASTATLRWYTTDATEFAVHDTVLVQDSNPTTWFNGFIVSISVSSDRLARGQYIVEARCISKSWLLDYPPSLITAAYQATDDQDIILAALTAAGVTGDITASTSTIDTIATAIDAAYRERTPREVLDDMAQASGGVWYEDAGTLYYNEEGNAGAAAWAINMDSPNGSTTFAVSKLKVERHWEQPVTDVTVLGAIDTRKRQITGSASVGGSPPRSFARVFESELIVSQEMADAVAAALIATKGAATTSCSFEFTDHDRAALRVNTLLTVTDSEHGLSSSTMLIRSVAMRQVTKDVTRFTAQAGGIIPGAEQLLRKIEANRRRQQSLPFFFLGYDFKSASTEWVSVPDASHLQDVAQLTVSFWMIPDSVTGTRTIIRKSTTFSGISETSGAAWVINMNGAQLRARRVDSGGTIVTAFYNSLTAGQIYHVTAVFNAATGTIQLYLDGEAVGTTGTGGSGVNSDVGVNIEIAYNSTADAAGDAPEIFDGFLSDIRLFNAVLGPQAIRELASRPDTSAQVWGSDLILQLKLDEYADGETISGTGAVRDSSMFANHGTPTNSPNGREELWT